MEEARQGRAQVGGARGIILNDLSPAATFITANYNLPFDVEAFAKAGRQLLKDIQQEIGWMYETSTRTAKLRGESSTQSGARYLRAQTVLGKSTF